MAAKGTTRYLTRGETSRLLRAMLKATFPGVSFRVRCPYGRTIDASWVDGPTFDQVDKVTYDFCGASFDPSQDLETTRTTTLNGERVVHGASYIALHRTYSVAFFTRVVTETAQRLGESIPPITYSENEGAYLGYAPSFKWDHHSIWVRDRLLEAVQKAAA